MNNDIHNNHEIDDLFKDAFNDFQAPPTNNLWSNIQNKLDIGEVDEVFSDALCTYEKEPSEKVWLAVKSEIPLSLALRNKLRYLSRVAAILIMVMLATIFFGTDKTTSTVPVAMETTENVESNFYNKYKASAYQELAYVERQSLAYQHHLEFSAKVSQQIAIKKRAIFEIDEPTLADLFDVDLEPINMDEERIKQILQPLDKLPLDAAFALATVNKEVAEKTIEIPVIRKAEPIPDLNIAVFPILKVADDALIKTILSGEE